MSAIDKFIKEARIKIQEHPEQTYDILLELFTHGFMTCKNLDILCEYRFCDEKTKK